MSLRRQFGLFLLRWILSAFGLWVAVHILGTFSADYDSGVSTGTLLLAGLVFSVINSILKPIIIILSLPAILLTLGLFTIIVNGFLVYLSIKLVPGVEMTFWYAVITGIILSLINYIISGVLDLRRTSAKEA